MKPQRQQIKQLAAPSRRDRAGALDLVVQALRADPATTAGLALRLNIKLPTLREYISELIAARRIRRVGLESIGGRPLPVWGAV